MIQEKKITIDTPFNVDDIKNKKLLTRLVKEETARIYSSPSARRGRSRDWIEARVLQGKTAELWMVENLSDYDFAGKKWHDLVNHNGEYCEIKAYEQVKHGFAKDNKYVKLELERLRSEKWNESKWLIVFNYDCGEYTFADIINIEEPKMMNTRIMAEEIIEIVNRQSNDYDAKERVYDYLETHINTLK